MRSLIFSIPLLALALSGCGPIDVGGECYYVGDTNGCVDGALCTPERSEPVAMGIDPTWDTARCRPLCNSGAECGAGTECRAVPGFERWRTCQPLAN